MATPSLHELKQVVLDHAIPIAQVIKDAPRLEHGVRLLEADRRNLLDDFRAYTAAPNDPTVAEGLTARLKEYRQRVSDLLHEAYAVDLGGET